jgi:uncharacterized OB-fold protein
MTDSGAYLKPLPLINSTNRPFWSATKAGELRFPRCVNCGSWVYPIATMCQACWSDNLRWDRVTGRGSVSSWVVYHRAFDPSFAEDVPYAVVQVDLEEGMRLISNLVDVEPGDIVAGLPVEAVFDPVTPEVTLVKFRRRRDGGS